MALTLDLTGPNKWQRVYYQLLQGNLENRKIKAPLIDPLELPFLFESHVLAVSAISSSAKPRWRTAGYLVQTYPGLSLESQVFSPASGADAASRRIGLNTLELVVFPKLANQFYLWFDPVHWLLSMTLGVWEFTGQVTDDTTELIETLKIDVLRVETKIDAL